MSPAEDMKPDAGEQRRTVLLVEDEVLVRMTLGEDLRDAGYVVIEAANADEARRLILAGIEFDLLVSDITMPGELDGASLALWLSEQHINTPIVLTSGLPTALQAAKASCANVDAFVPKPFDHTEFLRKVEALIGKRSG